MLQFGESMFEDAGKNDCEMICVPCTVCAWVSHWKENENGGWNDLRCERHSCHVIRVIGTRRRVIKRFPWCKLSLKTWKCQPNVLLAAPGPNQRNFSATTRCQADEDQVKRNNCHLFCRQQFIKRSGICLARCQILIKNLPFAQQKSSLVIHRTWGDWCWSLVSLDSRISGANWGLVSLLPSVADRNVLSFARASLDCGPLWTPELWLFSWLSWSVTVGRVSMIDGTKVDMTSANDQQRKNRGGHWIWEYGAEWNSLSKREEGTT